MTRLRKCVQFLRNNEISNKNNEHASWLKGNFHRRFSRESLRENEKYVFLQRSSCTPVIAVVQENPCARMRKMSPTNGRKGPLSSPLLQRFLVRESKKQKQQTIKTRNDPNPQQETTTTKNTGCGLNVLLAFEGDVCLNV